MIQQRQQSKGPGCVKLILWGCLGLILLVAVGGFIVYRVGKGIVANSSTDPAQVEAAIREALPGATVPPPYHGALKTGLMGYTMLIAASKTISPTGSPTPVPSPVPKGKDLTIMIFVFPAGQQVNFSDMSKQQQAQTGAKGQVVNTVTVQLPVRGKPAPFQKTITESNGLRNVQVLGSLSGADGHSVGLMFTAPESTFDDNAMMAFLKSIK